MSKDKITFTVNPAVEFIYCLYFIANEEKVNKLFADFNFMPSETFKKLIEEIRSKLSRYMRNEVSYFFEWSDTFHMLGRIIVEDGNIRSVFELINFIEKMDENELSAYIIKQALYGKKIEDGPLKDWDESVYLPDNVEQFILRLDDKCESDKEKLKESLENPSEIKTRLVLLLKQFYGKGYISVEKDILSELSIAKEKYEKLLYDDPDLFMEEYLIKDFDYKYDKLIIHVSYFVQIRLSLFYMESINNTLWINLGIYTEYYPTKKFIKVRTQKFVRVLSDKKRFDIIELLSKRPYYVHEIAKELELTPPTVSYHLNSLMELNLVSLERGINRTYYSLNKGVLKELFADASEILLGEDK